MRATGANPRMARAQGIAHRQRDLRRHGAVATRWSALAGALFAQTNGFADVTIGTGTIVVGLAAVIVGETLLPARRIGWSWCWPASLGSILYRLAIALALNVGRARAQGVGSQPRHRGAGGAGADPAGARNPCGVPASARA